MESKGWASKGGRQHYCDTTSPQRPCCWTARKTEMAALAAMDDARMAKYGALSCSACGKVYRVEDGIVEDHAQGCVPLTKAMFWS